MKKFFCVVLKIIAIIAAVAVFFSAVFFLTVHVLLSRFIVDEIMIVDRDEYTASKASEVERCSLLLQSTTLSPVQEIKDDASEGDAGSDGEDDVVYTYPSWASPDADLIINSPDLTPLSGVPTDLAIDYDVETSWYEYTPIYERSQINSNVFNILLVGLDSNNTLTHGTRSDTMLLVSYNKTTGDVKLVSFMRDTWVNIEGREPNRLNATYTFGGIGLLINTINDTYELDIQNYIVCGFNSFSEIIDKLGGLDIYLNGAEFNYYGSAAVNLGSGLCHMDGTLALRHARNRTIGNGDFSRTARQRAIIYALYNKMLADTSLNTITDIVTNCLTSVATNMKTTTLISLVYNALNNGVPDVEMGNVPFTNEWQYAMNNGRSVVYIDLEDNITLLHELLYGAE